MHQEITTRNETDPEGNPCGGEVHGLGIEIYWQAGPLGRGDARREPNGAFVEGVIEAARQRLEHYQNTRFRCRENALAITKLEEALHWLDARTRRREREGTEGTHEGV